MPVEIIDKLKPKNEGGFALMDTGDIETPSGKRLDEVLVCSEQVSSIFVLTQEEYDALDTKDETTLYLIKEQDA